MNIIESIREFIKTYPPLSGSRMNIDLLSEKEGSYSISAQPGKEWIKRYIDGSGEKQFLFVLSAREAFGEEIRKQIQNIGFFEAFSEWLAAQSEKGNLPILMEGKKAKKIETLSSGYLFIPDEATARYQIQCRLVYSQREVKK